MLSKSQPSNNCSDINLRTIKIFYQKEYFLNLNSYHKISIHQILLSLDNTLIIK